MATFNNGESGSSVRTKINAVLQHADGTAGEIVFNDAGADVDFRIESDTNANAFFLDGATGNVGIGTNNPQARLDVDAGLLRFADGWGPVWGASPNQPYISGSKASGFLNFGTNGSERMRIDSSGNVGVGVTPSAWGSGWTVLQLPGGSIMSQGFGGLTNLLNNAFYNGTNYIYSTTAPASHYRQNAGTHAWLNSPSGTAGNAITWTQAMTLDASGNLLVGATTAGSYSGDTVIGFGPNGGIVSKQASGVVDTGTVDIAINTGGGGYQGFLIVSNTITVSANVRTHTTFSVFGRGTDSSVQQIATDDGTSGGATFTVTTPSNGVIRVTNTSGNITTVNIQFFGGTSL